MKGVTSFFDLNTMGEKDINIKVLEKPISQNFFLCLCGSEILLCQSMDKDKEVQFAIFKYGQFHKKPNIWKRLKYCYYHLKTGKRFEDQILFDFDTAKKLGNWLIYNS